MDVLGVCPHCGYQLSNEAELIDGDFSYTAGTGLCYRGKRLPLSKGQHLLAGTLLRARGRTLSKDTLLYALGSEDCSDGMNLIAVLLSKTRGTLSGLGIPCPIETIWRVGLRWASGTDNPPPMPGNPGRPPKSNPARHVSHPEIVS